MLKIFKSVDEKIKELGFRKVKEDAHIVSYERDNRPYAYTQVVDICHKQSGRHIIQSYDKGLFDEKGVGNTNVGLTYYETKLFLKKMKQKKWNNQAALVY